uniref:Synaptopodin 2-like protein n=1 Tax=Periophthalmus magnuspinnatus TaxID=409849 RepID=A0A3B3ZG23_9GOBI
MVAEEVIITLSGGAPWGFRLQGGAEHQKPLQVAKVRKRSKACRAGLQEADELVSINDQPCGTLSHAQAMNLIDSFQSVVLVTRAPSPRIDKEYRAALRAMSPTQPQHAPVREVHRSRSSLTSGLTSPPGSEAYYGETDSDADVAGYERQRRQKRRSPSNSVPGPRDGVQEDDSGFLEPANVPLVSPERAKEALMLGSRSQLVPMVGPLSKPVDEELSKTYMEKAKQAKLNRGDTAQDKNVKEAKSKCRTIASLLTDAPNPHSKGVLMFKKRRQRSKKYTLTSFGSVDEDRCHDSQEEDGVFPGSESEFDEDGFSSVPDPTWDSDYIDMLEKRATAGTEGRGDGAEDAPSPGLSDISGKGAQLFEQQRKRAVEHAKKIEAAQQQVSPQPQVQEQPEIHQVSTVMSPQITTSEQCAEPNSLNRTARPFTPGFISIRASTAPVPFRPPVTKTSQRPASAAVMAPFPTTSEVTPYQPVFSTSAQTLQAAPPITAVHQAQLVTIPPLSVHTIPTAPQVPMPPPSLPPMPQTVPSAPAPPVATAVPQMTHVPVVPVSVVSQAEPVPPTPVPGSAGRTGILLDSMRRGGKPKPMFTVPERSTRQRYGQSSEAYAEEIQDQSADSDRHPPPVAPKPKVIHETTPILQAEGKGAQLFAKRQSRMGMYVVDTPPETPYQQEVAFHSSAQSGQPLMNPDLSSQWKYTPNVRAPPPIGYNPLLAPTIPSGPQRDARTESQVRAAPHRDGIKALDFMRRQPYQLNAAMFNYGVGSSLTTPKQIPVKTARVYEIKRFSTPTPMSAPSLTPKVIAPRSATTLGDRITRSGTTSPPAVAPFSHPQAPVSSFQSAPELSILAPKPRFVATKGGVQPRVWRPGAM